MCLSDSFPLFTLYTSYKSGASHRPSHDSRDLFLSLAWRLLACAAASCTACFRDLASGTTRSSPVCLSDRHTKWPSPTFPNLLASVANFLAHLQCACTAICTAIAYVADFAIKECAICMRCAATPRPARLANRDRLTIVCKY